MQPEIGRNSLINELVLHYPEAVGVLMSYGFHCIGCGLSGYETLAEGASAHGFSDEEIDEMVREIKKAVEESKNLAIKKPEATEKKPHAAGGKAPTTPAA